MRRHVLLLASLLLACRETPSPAAIDTERTGTGQETPPITSLANATIRFLNLEGGCWTLAMTGSSQRYQPMNLPEEFKVDGKRVKVTFHQLQGAASVCMVGPIVHIDHIAAAP